LPELQIGFILSYNFSLTVCPEYNLDKEMCNKNIGDGYTFVVPVRRLIK